MPPRYSVLLERAAERELDDLPPDVLKRIVSRIRLLADAPRPHGCRKLTGSASDWRIRVGEYRVVYEIDDRAREVRVMKVRLRNRAYL